MSKSTKVFAALILAMAMFCFVGCIGSGQAKTTDEEQEATVTGSHEYVDLGLPSGTLWATCNVGAYEPEERGYFLVWKDTEKLQKKYGWEKKWRTPTDTEWVELYKNTKCSWTTQNGEKGMQFVASNGKSIFLPAGEYSKFGKYWSSSPYPQDSKCAICFRFDFLYEKLYYEMSYEKRKVGMLVRPVRSK
jgi:hypothetical protein